MMYTCTLRGSPYPELSKNRFFFCFNRWNYYQRILSQNFTVHIGIVLMVEFRAVACAERAKGMSENFKARILETTFFKIACAIKKEPLKLLL